MRNVFNVSKQNFLCSDAHKTIHFPFNAENIHLFSYSFNVTRRKVQFT